MKHNKSFEAIDDESNSERLRRVKSCQRGQGESRQTSYSSDNEAVRVELNLKVVRLVTVTFVRELTLKVVRQVTVRVVKQITVVKMKLSGLKSQLKVPEKRRRNEDVRVEFRMKVVRQVFGNVVRPLAVFSR